MQDLQVVLLCKGVGRNISPLSEGISKYMLPVANKPLLAYSLENLEMYNARDIIVVVNDEAENTIRHYVEHVYRKLNSSTRIRIYSTEVESRTVEVLPALWKGGLLKKDFVMLRGDLLNEINFFKLLDFHYIKKSSITMVYEKVERKKEKNPPKPKPFQRSSNPDPFTHMLEEGTNRMISMIDPYELSELGIKMKSSLLARHPKVYLTNELQEKHIFVCSTDVCKILAAVGTHFSNFTDDFLPFLAYNQYNKKLFKIINEESHPASEIANYYSKVFGDLNDFFRPFVYITSEFSMKIHTLFDYHQANLLRMRKNGELLIFQHTANDVPDSCSLEMLKSELPTAPQTPTTVTTTPTQTPTPTAPATTHAHTPHDASSEKKVAEIKPQTTMSETAADKPTKAGKPEVKPDAEDTAKSREEKKAAQAAKKAAAREKELAAQGGQPSVPQEAQNIPNTQSKKAENKKDESKKEQPQQEEPKKDKPKADEPKIEGKPEVKPDAAETAKARDDKKAALAAKKAAAREKELAAQGGQPLPDSEVKKAPEKQIEAAKPVHQPRTEKKAEQAPTKAPVEASQHQVKPNQEPKKEPSLQIQTQPSVAPRGLNMVNEGSKTYDNSAVVGCLIGKNVKIGRECKIKNCVILDDVYIHDRCIIENCIISGKATIDTACSLEECVVKMGSKIAEGTKETKEFYL